MVDNWIGDNDHNIVFHMLQIKNRFPRNKAMGTTFSGRCSLLSYIWRKRFNRVHEEPPLDANLVFVLVWKDLLVVLNPVKCKEQEFSSREINTLTH